ncbi:MAG: class I SAM-dependent methyltransferase [Gemmatimonadota bacterium]|nr:class I SAM-dependent methyltransferase [Gemmatimonadota bacterium]MDH3421723.1 class I SAM-dependent methyltransferase [Gemmatimonadota bacterium]
MTCSRCQGIEDQFDARTARRQLRRYRRKGAVKTTRMLLDALSEAGIRGASFLDIGGGVGAIQHELADDGAGSGTSVDASPAYLETAKEEAQSRGYADRMRYIAGDFVEAQADVDAADLVTLDRVVCCYSDMEALVDASASRARRAYGLVYPRDNILARAAIRVVNLVQLMRRCPFRAFIHPTEAVEARVEQHGLIKTYHANWTMWQVTVFMRPATAANS